MKKYNINLFFITLRPWPLILSLRVILIFLNLIIFLNSGKIIFLFINLIINLIIIFFWWNDIINESTFLGFHNKYIIIITIYSIIIFIISEIFFFIRFFWSFFHFIFSPDIIIGSIWPYNGINPINYINLPILNSLLLISSGCSVTWSHYMILNNKINESKIRLLITVFLGIIFILLQLFEYIVSSFCFSDGVFGSIFFLATGFHGIHVIIGTLFLFFIYLRIKNNHFCYKHIIGFEFSIWYWHFVDVVWLYLYIIIYWLGR